MGNILIFLFIFFIPLIVISIISLLSKSMRHKSENRIFSPIITKPDHISVRLGSVVSLRSLNGLKDIYDIREYIKSIEFKFEEGEDIENGIDYSNLDINAIYQRIDKFNKLIYVGKIIINKKRNFINTFDISFDIEVKIDMDYIKDNPVIDIESGSWYHINLSTLKSIIDKYYLQIFRDVNLSKILKK